MHGTRLDHVQVAAPSGCEAAARRFYGGVLGLREVPKPAGVAASGGAWFVLDGDGRELHVGVAEPFAPARKAHPGLAVGPERFDALVVALEASGAGVTWDDRLAGVRRLYTEDPWGNRLELRVAGAGAGAAPGARRARPSRSSRASHEARSADGVHPLAAVLLRAAAGDPPPADGRLVVVPGLPGGLRAIVAFTAHAVIATDQPEEEALAAVPDAWGGATAPEALRWLAAPGGTVGVLDATLVAPPAAARAPRGTPLPAEPGLADHPRAAHALALREDVRVHGDRRGLVTLGRSLGGRLELSIEAFHPGRGDGPGLLADGLATAEALAPGEPVFSAVAPGNVRSLRLFLRAGFEPLGSEVVVRPAGAGLAGADPRDPAGAA